MKAHDLFWFAVALCFFGLILFAQSGDPAKPFPNHEEPPAGWSCHPGDGTHNPDTDERACRCLGMTEQPDPNHLCKPDQAREPRDNEQCKSYCHKTFCLCETQCEHV